VTSAVAGQQTTRYPASIIFGIPVSKVVRDKLQTAQNLVSGSDAAVNMPTLTTGQVNAAFTGAVSDWASLAGITVSATDNNIYLARRSNTSGTTRIFNKTFVGEFCRVASGTVAISGLNVQVVLPNNECRSLALTGATNAVPFTGVYDGGKLVRQLATSDDMASCIDQYNTDGVGAIGHLSTDYVPSVGGVPSGWRFVKIDGQVPSALNVVTGRYKMWSESSINYNTARYNLLTGTAKTDFDTFYNSFKTASASGQFWADVNSGLPQLEGWTGGFVTVAPNSTYNSGWGASGGLAAGRTDTSLPINALTRIGGGGPNLCNYELPTTGYVAQ
jgi:hypothetical protein